MSIVTSSVRIRFRFLGRKRSTECQVSPHGFPTVGKLNQALIRSLFGRSIFECRTTQSRPEFLHRRPSQDTERQSSLVMQRSLSIEYFELLRGLPKGYYIRMWISKLLRILQITSTRFTGDERLQVKASTAGDQSFNRSVSLPPFLMISPFASAPLEHWSIYN